MMDVPLMPPASQEQVIEQRLVACGLNSKGITVTYEDYLQSIEIVIRPEADATSKHFQCINDAAASVIVRFEDADLYRAYIEYKSELYRPIALDSARKALAERGLLEGFPERSDFQSDDTFAEALEVHCGLQPKSTIQRTEFGLIVIPEAFGAGPLSGKHWDRMTCLMGALMYVSARDVGVKIGFVGNEQLREPEEK